LFPVTAASIPILTGPLVAGRLPDPARADEIVVDENIRNRFHLDLGDAALYATLYPQLASMAGAPLGGWLADGLRRHIPSGRIIVQVLAMLAGAPCVYLCGQANSLTEILAVLTAWGLCKGVYDANIFAAVYDVIPAAARGTTAGFMNMMGWLAGGASAPLVIGYLAERHGMGAAISSASIVYVAAGMLLLLAGLVFLRFDLRAHLTVNDQKKAD